MSEPGPLSREDDCRQLRDCGEERALTLDHVPPRILLAEPYPENLIMNTVAILSALFPTLLALESRSDLDCHT